MEQTSFTTKEYNQNNKTNINMNFAYLPINLVKYYPCRFVLNHLSLIFKQSQLSVFVFCKLDSYHKTRQFHHEFTGSAFILVVYVDLTWSKLCKFRLKINN